ncbi:MAG TPA: M13-type metalloendopeptidase [Microbacteriaceae bacterium]|nr:M13-type metalloendopeptidase [Microbacteriaceae bacterium]
MSQLSGIDLNELDPAVRPQDDLFRHVNGKWMERTEIPADKSRWGSFMILAIEAEKAVHDIILEAQSAPAGSEPRKFGDLYASFMNVDAIESAGTEPIQPALARAQSIESVSTFLRELGAFERAGVGGFAALYVDNDPGNPDRYIVCVEQAGIGLPDESYFREERFAQIRDSYLAHLERMFGLCGLDAQADRARRVFELETAIAAVHWDNVASRDSQATYNLTKWKAFTSLLGDGLDAELWRDGMGVPSAAFAELVVRQPSFVTGVGQLLTAERLPAWRDWLSWRIISANAGYLSDDIVQAQFDFYGRTLSGTPQLRERWKRGVSLVEGGMGEAVGKVYVERHFAGEAKLAMDRLVANLIEAYRQSITQLDWMGPETRTRALEKLDKFTPKIGYPDEWRDYSSLSISADDLIGNVAAIAEFGFQREIGKLGKPIDRNEWFMTPQTINAYYNPGFNEIVFPAAILQPPFFSTDWDDAANYGAIGAVIGHEIGHGFDDQGSRFDGDGRLIDWWTEADRAAFEARTAALIAQYDALEPAQTPGHHVNGALTIGENIGDLGGLAIAWKAYQLSLRGAEPPVIDGLTGAERFFLSWSAAWQLKARDEEVIRLLAIDPHAPAEFRCNQIVRNLNSFVEAFDVTEGDALWLAPEDRVSIW